MSRSYKKNPICTDRPHGAKYWKRRANKKVRKYNKIFNNGNSYKKLYCSYDIHDYVSRYTKAEAIHDYFYSVWYSSKEQCFISTYEEYENVDQYLNKNWKKYYFRK